MIETITPRETVRAACQQCLGLKRFNTEAVRDCQGDAAYIGTCPLYPFRLGKRIPVRMFRKYCLQCQGGHSDFVQDCEMRTCPTYNYRMGKNPALTGKRKASQAGIDALRKYRQNRRDDRNERQISTFPRQGMSNTGAGIL